MANIKTRALKKSEFENIINLIKTGFTDIDGKNVKANVRISVCLVLQANVGCRISDIIRLKLSDFHAEDDSYRLCIIEKKTGKKRSFSCNSQIYTYLLKYALVHGISEDAHLFDITSRGIQRKVQQAAQKLGLRDVSTHSFRKFFAMNMYEATNFDIRLIQELLQHSSITTTERYLSVNKEKLDKILKEYVSIPN